MTTAPNTQKPFDISTDSSAVLLLYCSLIFYQGWIVRFSKANMSTWMFLYYIIFKLRSIKSQIQATECFWFFIDHSTNHLSTLFTKPLCCSFDWLIDFNAEYRLCLCQCLKRLSQYLPLNRLHSLICPRLCCVHVVCRLGAPEDSRDSGVNRLRTTVAY